MELESVSKYLKLQAYPAYTEVAYNGAPCLAIVENASGYCWMVVPLFARMVYGANTLADLPYCNESYSDMEEAIADGVARLHELGAFIEYDIDQYNEMHTEMVSEECLELAQMYSGDIFEAAALYKEMLEEAFAHPNHKKLDKNKNGKLDKEDFEILRSDKKAPVAESEEQLDEVENAFMSVFGPKKQSTSYDLPGHAVMDVKQGPNGETHVKRISKEGQVTTTKYNSSGAAIGKIKHDDEDPKAHFKAAGIKLDDKPKRGRGRPKMSGAATGTTHDDVKKKLAAGETLTRYEKIVAQKHGLVPKGKAGRKGKELDDAGSEELFKTLALRSLKKVEKGMKTEEVEILDEAPTFTPYKAGAKVTVNSPGHELHGKTGEVFHTHPDGSVNVALRNAGGRKNLTLKPGQFKKIAEEVELTEEKKSNKLRRLIGAFYTSREETGSGEGSGE